MVRVNTAKVRLAGIALLDRAFVNLSDDELANLLTSLPDDHRAAVCRIAGLPPETLTSTGGDGGEEAGDDDGADGDDANVDGAGKDDDVTDAAAVDDDVVPAVRAAASKGRMNGQLEQLAGVLTDVCLADCIEQLGDQADLPSEDDLLRVAPGLAERHGLGVVRLMLASAVAGEAPASPAIIRLLKHDETLALPAAAPARPQPAAKAMSAEELAERERIKARRKEDRRQKQAEQAARRAQAAEARRGSR